MYTETGPKNVSGLHNPKYTVGADTLHCMGKTFVQVSRGNVHDWSVMKYNNFFPHFSQMFGEDNADEDVSPDTADPEAGADAGQNALDSEANKEGNVERVSTKKWAKNCEYDPEKLFNKFFYDDIQYLLSMANLWKDRTPPRPTKWGDFSEVGTSGAAVGDQSLGHNQKIWSLRECADVFAESVAGLKKTFGKLADDDHLVWDKDDKDGMDFVAACANIRANVFGIGQKSRFEIKCKLILVTRSFV